MDTVSIEKLPITWLETRLAKIKIPWGLFVLLLCAFLFAIEVSYSLRGLSATQILQAKMNDLSWQWLNYLLEEYPDHVVEFSCFSKCWGTVPGYNTVFWEVRRY